VPIPRRFDRRPPERDQTRINERIRVPQVRLIGDDGNQIGVIPTDEALKYEQEQKAKAARRHQKQVTVREIKLRPKIANNDYETKKGHVERFLNHGDRVKVTIMFRGRETTHPERGEALLMRLAEDIGELGVIEQRPNLDGRNMTMVMAPARMPEEGEQPAEQEPEPRPAKRERREVRLRREAKEADGGGDAPADAEEPTPAAAAPPAEQPAAAEPAAEEPAAAAEEPATDEPAAEEPAAEEAPDEDAPAEEPAADEPAAEEPVAEAAPEADAPAEEPAADEDTPNGDAPAAKKKAPAKKAPAKKKAAAKPGGGKTAAA
jgi:translation initiation factor IF-3